jgi:hypothetical protein
MRNTRKLAAVVAAGAGTLAVTMLSAPAEARPSAPSKVYTASLDALNTHISGTAADGTATCRST